MKAFIQLLGFPFEFGEDTNSLITQISKSTNTNTLLNRIENNSFKKDYKRITYI